MPLYNLVEHDDNFTKIPQSLYQEMIQEINIIIKHEKPYINTQETSLMTTSIT